MPMNPADLAADLAVYERQVDDFGAEWRCLFLAAREKRAQFLALCACVGELGRTASASGQSQVRELARVYFASAERMGAASRQIDAAMRTELSTICQFVDLGEPSPKELGAAVSEWRAKIAAAMPKP